MDKFDLDSIIAKSVKSSVKGAAATTGVKLDEAYVVQQQQFKQASETISQKTKDAHTNLYKGYIDALNKISAELDTADRTDVNSRHSKFRSLKLDETYNANGSYLHELYFGNSFDPNSEIFMDSLAYMRLQRDFGTFDDWQRDFMACAMSAGNGWAVCGYSLFLKKFINTQVSHHSGDVMVGFVPLIVLDMWEHAYYHDFLDDKKSYIVSRLKEFNWKVIEERFKKVDDMIQAVK